METPNFSLDHIKNLSPNDAKEYLTKYFIPLTDGNHAFYLNGKFHISEPKVIKSTYFNRMSKELNEFYFKDYTAIKTITYKLNEPQFIENELNLCPPIKAKKIKMYSEYDEHIKQGVNAILSFIKDVLASNNSDAYDYLIKWLANMLKGNKNDSCLYLKGQQGIGKSTLFEFLKDYVIGVDLLLESGSEPLRNTFNGILGGKLLVVFEELENISSSEWTFISSKLKRYITSNTYTLEEKYMKMGQTNNINNYIINSNNDAIKDDDGRRYFILDVSHKYKENHQYFGKLREKAFNDLVGEAFYTYMLEVDTNGFIPQKYPITQSKLNSFVKRLDKVYEFIKDEFVLPKNDMIHTTKELYEQYTRYCQIQNYKKIDKTSFAEKLKQININYKKTKGNNFYTYPSNILVEIAQTNKWLHELDEVSDNTNNDDEVTQHYENMIEEKNNEIINLKDIIEQQQKEIESLKINQRKVVKKKSSDKNDDSFTMSYEDYMDKRKLGKYFGYPNCCINEFMECYEKGIPTSDFCKEASYEGFVPCREHSKQIKNRAVNINDLIRNRICKKAFPDSDDEFIIKCREIYFPEKMAEVPEVDLFADF